MPPPDSPPCSTRHLQRLEAPPLSHASRRIFLAAAALTTAGILLPRSGVASSLVPSSPLLCSLADNTLALLDANASRQPAVLARIASPRAHAPHPTLPITYIANAVSEHQGRPHGTISALHLAPHREELALLGTEPLALFSTRPEVLAVSPSGRHLVVLSAKGGSINLLPLTASGEPTPVTHVLRFASQARSAPSSIVFHPALPVAYVTDQATDALLVLHLNEDSLSLTCRHQLPATFQPTHLALSAEDNALAVASDSTPTVMEFSLDPATGLPAVTTKRHTVPGESVGPLLIHSSTGTLLVTSRQGASAALSQVSLAASVPSRNTASIPLPQVPAHLLALGPQHLALAGAAGLHVLDVQSHAITPLSAAGIFGLSTWPTA